jgi:hypothetical protein
MTAVELLAALTPRATCAAFTGSTCRRVAGERMGAHRRTRAHGGRALRGRSPCPRRLAAPRRAQEAQRLCGARHGLSDACGSGLHRRYDGPRLITLLGDEVNHYKIGFELFRASGAGFVGAFMKIFLVLAGHRGADLI